MNIVSTYCVTSSKVRMRNDGGLLSMSDIAAPIISFVFFAPAISTKRWVMTPSNTITSTDSWLSSVLASSATPHSIIGFFWLSKRMALNDSLISLALVM